MPLTPEQLQEMQELEELEALEQQFGAQPPAEQGGGLLDSIPKGVKDFIGAQDAYRRKLVESATFGHLKFPGHDKSVAASPTGAAAGDLVGSVGAGAAINTVLPGSALPKAAGYLGRVAQGGIVGGAQGAATGLLQKPPEGGSRLDQAWEGGKKGMLYGAGGTAAIDPLAKFLMKSGDVAMQSAVGRRKYTPGVGTTLADEGVIGTQSMMNNQVGNRLNQRGQQINEIAGSIPADITNDASAMGQRIAAGAAKPLSVAGAAPSKFDQEKLALIGEFGDDVASRGAETGSQVLQRRIAAGQRSYRGKENPLQSLLGQLSKGEQIEYSQALKEMAGRTGRGEELATADKAYGALKRAQSSLAEEPSIPRSLIGLLGTSNKLIPGASAATSVVGQGATKIGQGAAEGADILRNALLMKYGIKE